MTKKNTFIELTVLDLPAVCPNKNMSSWDSHPKVSLEISHGSATCPYCGTHYHLKVGEYIKDH